jgi:fucose 4-O-acetylase-like acetyltransferase
MRTGIQSELLLSEKASAAPGSFRTKPIHYNFVDFIRILGVAGIIWAHVPIFPPQNFNPLHFDYYFLYFPFMLFWKFGVINFFMISGFLLKGKLDNNPFDYLKKRFLVLMKPYMLALILFSLLYGYHVLGQISPDSTMTESIYYVINKIVLSTSFWFVPSYLVCLTTLVLTRKYVNSLYYGLLLFLVTLAIAITSAYFPQDTIPYLDMAVGFQFFLWLGYSINNKVLVDRILQKSNFFPLLILVMSALAFSSFECHQLCINQSPTYFNILRVTNIVYSVLMFVFMMHVFNNVKSNNILSKVKSNAYSMYLYHPIFAWVVAPKVGIIIENVFSIEIFQYAFIRFSAIFILTYLLIFLATYILVKILKHFPALTWAFPRN